MGGLTVHPREGWGTKAKRKHRCFYFFSVFFGGHLPTAARGWPACDTGSGVSTTNTQRNNNKVFRRFFLLLSLGSGLTVVVSVVGGWCYCCCSRPTIGKTGSVSNREISAVGWTYTDKVVKLKSFLKRKMKFKHFLIDSRLVSRFVERKLSISVHAKKYV